jgi:hypothetical protein
MVVGVETPQVLVGGIDLLGAALGGSHDALGLLSGVRLDLGSLVLGGGNDLVPLCPGLGDRIVRGLLGGEQRSLQQALGALHVLQALLRIRQGALGVRQGALRVLKRALGGIELGFEVPDPLSGVVTLAMEGEEGGGHLVEEKVDLFVVVAAERVVKPLLLDIFGRQAQRQAPPTGC